MSEETIFHRIVRREIPAEVVYEDDDVLAFRDINPVSPTHVLVVPKKKTIPSLKDALPEDERLLGHMLHVCSTLARSLKLEESGYRVVINSGKGAGQVVFQLHLHLLGGRDFSWPPG